MKEVHNRILLNPTDFKDKALVSTLQDLNYTVGERDFTTGEKIERLIRYWEIKMNRRLKRTLPF